MSSLTICHRRDTNDLLQGQRSLFSESKLLTLPAGGFGAVFCVHLASRVSTGGGGEEKGEKKKRNIPAAVWTGWNGCWWVQTANRTAQGSQVSHQVHFPAAPSSSPVGC